jgi:eukaryotic-like serine/threonine-protein kinase
VSLAPGVRLGPYEITVLIGEGGMGEVWRARHIALKRDDALKVLPDAFASDPDRLARFRREAQVLASLNHPNIAHVYGLEQADGVQALVMELVEGPTLADRIAQGPVPLDEALPIAKQIAEALEAAHEQGIIHRDLKPANIKLRPDGTVKVLDFGLAKLTESVGDGRMVGSASLSPTITSPAVVSGVAVLLGTAAYMSPEQARAKPVDRRTDIWAFGCVLFEMLTGKRVFDGEDVTHIIAAVVRLEPDWSALPGDCPSPVRTLLRRCLEKDPRRRIADISTALFVLDEIHDHAGADLPDAPDRRGRRDPAYYTRGGRRRVAYVAAAMLAVGGAIATSVMWVLTRPAPPRVTRATITPPADAALTIDGFDRDLAITADGTRIVYAGATATRLFVRALDALEPVPLVALSGGGAQGIFTSPDSQWVGYVESNNILKKVAITGGPPVTLLTMGGNSRGVTWAPDDMIIFASGGEETGLQRVSAAGGSVTVLTRPNRERGELDHLWPEMLPGGRRVLFTIIATAGGLDAAQVAVLDLDTGTYQTVLRGGSHAHYVSTGHLVYAAAGTLRAVAFDLDRLETRGTPVPVVPRLVTTQTGAADFGVASDGTLVYVDAPGFDVAGTRTLVWVDRKGVATPIAAPPRIYTSPRLSPDGSRVALAAADAEQDLWIWDLERGGLTRLTFEPDGDDSPVWTPDGRRIVYSGRGRLYVRAADGTGTAEQLTSSDHIELATTITPDAAHVVFEEAAAVGQPRDLRMITLPASAATRQARGAAPAGQASGESATTLLETRFAERNAAISPDGRWLAYEANPSGVNEVYVRPFPNVGDGQWQVSTGGGVQPLWNRNGRELFYFGPPGALLAVAVDTRVGGWNAGPPKQLFTLGNLGLVGPGFVPRMYDVSADGQRFLMIRQGSNANIAPPQIVVVQHWLEELKRLVPTN